MFWCFWSPCRITMYIVKVCKMMKHKKWHTLVFVENKMLLNHNWQTLHQYTGSQICWHFDFLACWHFCLGTCWHFVSMTCLHSSWGTFLHSNRLAVRHTGGLGSRSNLLHLSFGTWKDKTKNIKIKFCIAWISIK